MKSFVSIVLTILMISGCNGGNFIGQMDTPLQLNPYTQPIATDIEQEQLVQFLYEAEMMMQKPLKEATMNKEGIKVFSEPIKTKDDLFHYYQTYLSIELAETMARKISDLSRSRENEYLAVSNDNIDWFSIYDASEESIKVVHHTIVQSVVEMDIEDDPNTRIQYTIMKDKFGENPKIVQKTILYN